MFNSICRLRWMFNANCIIYLISIYLSSFVICCRRCIYLVEYDINLFFMERTGGRR